MKPAKHTSHSLLYQFTTAEQFRQVLIQLAKTLPDCNVEDISVIFLPPMHTKYDPLREIGYLGVSWNSHEI